MARATSVEVEFTELVAARWPHLVRTAILLGCTPADAEDVVQTALARCLKAWSRVRRADDRDAYVHRVLVNTFLDSRRRRSSREMPAEHAIDRALPDAADRVGQRLTVEGALGRLTLDQRLTVVLRYYLDLSEAQMATVLDVAPGTVKSRLSRALTALSLDPDLSDHAEEQR